MFVAVSLLKCARLAAEGSVWQKRTSARDSSSLANTPPAGMFPINAKSEGNRTYVRLPRNRLPKQFRHMRDPVFRLTLALYGHPDSGGHWEIYCYKMLARLGWIQISGGWRSVFWHPADAAMLVVYVDDFRMAGPATVLPKLWKAIRDNIKLSDPETNGKFLGCECTVFEHEFPAGGDPWRDFQRTPGMKIVKANCMEYNMESFLSSCVDKYCELAKVKRESLKKVCTPFIDESMADKEWDSLQDALAEKGELKPEIDKPLKLEEVGDPLQLDIAASAVRGKKRMRMAGTPNVSKEEKKKQWEDRNKKNRDKDFVEGKLSSIAARILMKILYAARFARFDLLRAVGSLASMITR